MYVSVYVFYNLGIVIININLFCNGLSGFQIWKNPLIYSRTSMARTLMACSPWLF